MKSMFRAAIIASLLANPALANEPSTDLEKLSYIILNKLKRNESYEEIDTRIASGWYVDVLSGNNKKKFKTKEVVFKIAKKTK